MRGIEPCCEQIKTALENDPLSVGGIFVCDDGSIDVMGCCGGGCNVLSNITFCPFCGRHIQLTLGNWKKEIDASIPR